MDKLRPPDPIAFDGNTRNHWKGCKQELELHFVAAEKGKENKAKSSIFFILHGSIRQEKNL